MSEAYIQMILMACFKTVTLIEIILVPFAYSCTNYLQVVYIKGILQLKMYS